MSLAANIAEEGVTTLLIPDWTAFVATTTGALKLYDFYILEFIFWMNENNLYF